MDKNVAFKCVSDERVERIVELQRQIAGFSPIYDEFAMLAHSLWTDGFRHVELAVGQAPNNAKGSPYKWLRLENQFADPGKLALAFIRQYKGRYLVNEPKGEKL